MTTDQLELNFPPSDTPDQKWEVGLYRDDVLVSTISNSADFLLTGTFDACVESRKRWVQLNREHDQGIVWEESARGTGWFGVKNVPGESTTVYALFITKA